MWKTEIDVETHHECRLFSELVPHGLTNNFFLVFHRGFPTKETTHLSH